MIDFVKCSVVIPCYNSQNSITELVGRLLNEDLNMFKITEIICVNDFSNDNTLEILKDLDKSYDEVKILNNSQNLGQVQSTLYGIRYSNEEFIVTLDDDLQHPVEEVYKLLNTCLNENLDFVIGTWKLNENKIRNFSSYVANFILNLISLNFDGYKFTAFRVINSRIKKNMVEVLDNTLMMDLRKISKNYKMVMVNHNSKPFGREFTPFLYRVKLIFNHIKNELG